MRGTEGQGKSLGQGEHQGRLGQARQAFTNTTPRTVAPLYPNFCQVRRKQQRWSGSVGVKGYKWRLAGSGGGTCEEQAVGRPAVLRDLVTCQPGKRSSRGAGVVVALPVRRSFPA